MKLDKRFIDVILMILVVNPLETCLRVGGVLKKALAYACQF